MLEELGRDDEAEVWFGHADAAAEALEFADNGGEDATMEIIEEDMEIDQSDVETPTEDDSRRND